jgi:Uma2 family endonuclease
VVQMAALWAAYQVPDRLPDDTEESIVGTEWHQEAIGDLADKLREGARRQGATWDVCEQVALLGLRRADGRAYDPRPDVLVLREPLPSGSMSAIALVDTGAPLFIAEVASRSTVGDDVGAKREVYEAVGVREYVVFDPGASLLSTPVLAWRWESGSFVPWQTESDGWWRSASLGLSFQAMQPFVRVRDREGREIPPSRALHVQLEGLHAQLEDERQRRLALEDELRRLRGDHTA